MWLVASKIHVNHVITLKGAIRALAEHDNKLYSRKKIKKIQRKKYRNTEYFIKIDKKSINYIILFY